MSLTSCFRYVIELPTDTLNAIVAGVIDEADAAGVQTTFHRDDVVVGAYTATVDARVDPAHPPRIDLTPTDLGLVMHLTMTLDVTIAAIVGLDPIEYQLAFDFPGRFVKTTPTGSPPELDVVFPGLTAAMLNLNVGGGQVPLTPALVEPQVHAMYAANPALAHNLQTGVMTGLPAPDDVWSVTVDLYDDDPGAMPFRGRITVTIPDPTHVAIHMPGHLRAQNIAQIRIDSDIVVHVKVPIVQGDGVVTVALDQVTAADVTIDWSSPNLYTTAGGPLIAARFAARIAALPDFSQTTPTQAEIRAAIAQALLDYGATLTLPMLKSTPPANPGDMDLTTFVPTTLGGQSLALQLEQQPVPCDVPDAFVAPSPFAVAIDREKCDATIQPVIAAENGRTRNIRGHDVDVHDLTVELSDPGDHGVADGHLWIAGQATIHIDCWPDSHIGFQGPVTLTPDRQPDGSYRFRPVAGQFSADDPCCASTDPNAIAALIEGDDYPPIGGLPSRFAGVGSFDIELTSVDIFRAGIVLRGSLALATTHALEAGAIRHHTYWASEPARGG